MPRIAVSARLIALVVILASCSGDNGPVTVDGYTVALTTAPPGTAFGGTTVTATFLLTENESDGTSRPASAKSVSVQVTAGGGTVNGGTTATIVTSDNGSGSITWVLGPGAVQQTLRISVLSGNAVDVTVASTTAPASQLAMATLPSASVVHDTPFPQQPVVQVKDSYGNPISQSGLVVTASIESGTGTLAGTTTSTTDANGRATFSGLAVAGGPGLRTLRFSATVSGSAASATAPVVILSGPATQLAFSTLPPATTQSGVSFTPAPVVQVRDASGYDVSTAGVAVSVAVESGGGTVTGPLGVNTVAGSATFTGLALSGTAGPRTLRFSAVVSGVVLTIVSPTITVQ